MRGRTAELDPEAEGEDVRLGRAVMEVLLEYPNGLSFPFATIQLRHAESPS